MNFPNYVPEGARNHASQFLGCYEASLAKSKLRLIELTTQLAYWQQPGHDPQLSENQLDQLRRQKNVEINHQDTLASDIETIRRLVHDERMKEAYRLLNDAFFEDTDQDRQTKFGRFIYAAWQAHLDFSQYRDRLKRAAFLRDQIADTANNLASQLHKIEKTGVSCPKIFFSIHELLLNTDNNKWDGYNINIWRELRGYVFGDPHLCDPSENENTRHHLRYGWENSPSISDLLLTISKAAREFEPSESGIVGVAIDSKKRSVKTEYIRAFGSLLTNQHHFSLTKQIMKAMVPTANVTINAPDIDVTYDDVRKALAKLDDEQLEDSGQK